MIPSLNIGGKPLLQHILATLTSFFPFHSNISRPPVLSCITVSQIFHDFAMLTQYTSFNDELYLVEMA